MTARKLVMPSAVQCRSSPDLSCARHATSACSGKATRRTAAAWKRPQHSAKCNGVASVTSQTWCDTVSLFNASEKLQFRAALGLHPARTMWRMDRKSSV
eukprot:261255-Rhodomonas_salina.1